jgi:hypothetical protein
MRTRTKAALAATVLLPAGILAGATPAVAQSGEATVSVFHGVPGLVVDVYANGQELLPNFEPGTLTDPLSLPAGTYDIQVFPDGQAPGSGSPAIEATGVQVPAGANATITANLTECGQPALNVFVNDTANVPAGQARLTVRHVASAPAVDIRAGGTAIVSNLTNPNQATTEVPAGAVSADVVLAGTDTVAIGPADLDLREGTNTIVYAWGSAADNNLALQVQTITGLHSAPGGVPAGDGSAQEGGLPAWAVGLLAVAAVGAGVSGLRLARSRG